MVRKKNGKMAPHYFDGRCSRWITDILADLDADQDVRARKHREAVRAFKEKNGRLEGANSKSRKIHSSTRKCMPGEISEHSRLRQIGENEGTQLSNVKGGDDQIRSKSPRNIEVDKEKMRFNTKEIKLLEEKYPIGGAEIAELWKTTKTLKIVNAELEKLILPILSTKS